MARVGGPLDGAVTVDPVEMERVREAAGALESIGRRPGRTFADATLSPYAFPVLALPVIALPAGSTSGGLPVDLLLVGRRFREGALVAAGVASRCARPELFGRLPEVDGARLRAVHPSFKPRTAPLAGG